MSGKQRKLKCFAIKAKINIEQRNVLILTKWWGEKKVNFKVDSSLDMVHIYWTKKHVWATKVTILFGWWKIIFTYKLFVHFFRFSHFWFFVLMPLCIYSKNEALQEYWKHFDAQCICMGFDTDFSSQGHQILFYPKYDQRGKNYSPFFIPQIFKYPIPMYQTLTQLKLASV